MDFLDEKDFHDQMSLESEESNGVKQGSVKQWAP